MSRILSDREVRRLIGSVILGAEERFINPNGIELRLGGHVKFISTGEEKAIPEGSYIKVDPGESIIIVSLETLDFRQETVEKHFPGCGLMAWITPTTTMMREGIMQSATKIDAGYQGQLNWGLRNSSFKELIIGRGESIFKLTFFVLEGNEVPEVPYGERREDKYQGTEGIKSSGRRIPADISKSKLVSSSAEKMDPKKSLREAGYPFDHISSELLRLDGKFELVSTDVKVLTSKIESEIQSVLTRVDEFKGWLTDHVEVQFSKKFTAVIGTLVGAILFTAAAQKFLQGVDLGGGLTVFLFAASGAVALLVTWILIHRFK